MSLRSLLASLAAASLAACASGCSSTGGTDHAAVEAARPKPTLMAAHELQFTETFEVRFGNELVGYMVDVLPVPGGIVDSRAYAPGTKLIQGKDFTFLGFISPRGTTYRFDASGEAKAVGVGSLELSIAAFFKQNGAPTFVSISPGAKPAGAASGT